MFKVPEIPASKRDKAKKENSNNQNASESSNPTSSSTSSIVVKKTDSQDSNTKQKKPSNFPPLNYSPPENRADPAHQYKFEVLKQGSIIETINIPTDQDYFVFGRLPNCDFIMDHPSCSRYHAVLQFCEDDSVFLYDFNSVHKTFLNKKQIPPNTLTRLELNDQIRFGLSSRTFIFSTSDPHLLEQSTQKIDELYNSKVLNYEKVQSGSALQAHSEAEITWGFQEDAVETETVSSSLDNTESFDDDSIQISDPRTKLIDFLNSRGLTMEFDTTYDSRSKEFTSKIYLPIQDQNGSSLFGAGHGSRKKESQNLAILNACRIIHRNKLFAYQKKETRSSSIDQDDRSDSSGNNEDIDDIDSYVVQLQVDETRSKIKLLDTQISEMQNKLDSLQQVLAVAKSKTSSEMVHKKPANNNKLEKEDPSGIMRANQEKIEEASTIEPEPKNKSREPISDFKMKSKLSASVEKEVNSNTDPTTARKNEQKGSEPEFEEAKHVKTIGEKRKIGPLAPSDINIDGDENDNNEKRSKSAKQIKELKYDFQEDINETWAPPKNQSGDGRTHLNDKYGY
ncbi:hypothetical protein BB560_003595 [Smittium megazygosporum]|uniref:FHA domain-containing protein n=1 Tax=Smittium megazygosporum TaxID=133381 RepID=A0A2T9ZBQ0_9FUNG|nr:hypothetical protein BB560_003595 [Smittium megazygosporum]